MNKVFGNFQTAVDAAEHFRQELGYIQAEPVQVTVLSPGHKNIITLYGILYNRPEFRDEDWLYLLASLGNLKSVYSRKHYYTVNGEDWYIAGYTTDSSLEEPYVRYNPFGHNIGMTAWRGAYPIDTDRWGHPVDKGTYPRLITVVSIIDSEGKVKSK